VKPPATSSRRGRISSVLAGAALLLILFPTAAGAHAKPVDTNPADGEVLPQPPETITVTFDEPVSLPAAGNQLLNAQGKVVRSTVTVRDDALTFRPVSPLTQGTFVVSWRVISSDSHPVAGGFAFSVGTPSATSIERPTAPEQREVNVVRLGAETIRYGGLLAMAGLVAFLALVAPNRVREHVEAGPRLRRGAAIAGVSALLGQLVLVPIAVLWESGQPLADLFTTGTWTTAWGSPTTWSALVVMSGVLVSLAALWRNHLIVSAMGAALAVGSLAIVGHTRTFGPSWLVLSADLTHAAAASMWFGGLIGLIICLTATPAMRPKVTAELLVRFSRVAGFTVAALLLAGIVLYWRIGHSFAGLWTSRYGQIVFVKSALMVPVILLAAWNRRLIPAIVTRNDSAARHTLTRLIWVEAGVLVAVLAATSVVVTQTPPDRSFAPATPVASQTLTLALNDTTRALVVVTPVRRGVNAIGISITDLDNKPVQPLEVPELSVSQKAHHVGPLDRPLSPTGAAAWEATADLPLTGTWSITVAVRLSTFDNPVVTGTIEVP
jgi:copper transport protein